MWKTLSKLSRASLLSLAAQWCEEENLRTCGPHILNEDDEDDPEAPYAAAESLAEIEGLYVEDLPSRKGSKREVVDRILEGDWRRGISMRQLAMAESQYILEHQSANRWAALRLTPYGEDDNEHEESTRHHLPRLHAATFLRSLQKEISPIAKAHFYIHQPSELPVTLLRIYLHDTPYNTTSSLRTSTTTSKTTRKTPSEAPKSIFVLFPTGTPYIYVSLSSSGTHLTDPESKSLLKFIVEAIPKALSCPSQRYELKPTSFTARSLSALLAHRGAERSNAAAGGWSIFVTDSKGRNALDFRDGLDEKTTEDDEQDADKENHLVIRGSKKRPFSHTDPSINNTPQTKKRLKLLASSRFGDYGLLDDGKNLHNFSVRITDPFDRRPKARVSDEEVGLFVQPHEGEEEPGGYKPDVKFTFQGSHVFAGLRMLVEKGIIDGSRMAGWMTGEAGVSVGTVREGKIETWDF